MTKGSKIIISVAGALAAGLIINYLLHTEKGSEIGQQLKKAAGDLLDKGKELLVKSKEESEANLKEATV
ncbi:YtxH domain-containing protein [Lacibacter sp. H375]|uniref:YtxH domain-containing protein n=1 Tax=Lacibacter sp. H375 TaxID=3133424 RepID=UPI0030C3BE68